MEASFTFDGKYLRLRLSVEGTQERALAELMDKFSVASVSVDYGQYHTGSPRGVDIVLREPEPVDLSQP